MNDEQRARVEQLQAEVDASHEAFMAAADAKDVSTMIAASRRWHDLSDEITRLANPRSWQAKQLVDSWSAEQMKHFAHWMSGYAPDHVLRYELAWRDLDPPQQS